MVQRLAVIGAGPKGAAIAAKAAALRLASYHGSVPDIDLYDPSPVGAAWRGVIGYTDGEQPLCTLAERDLGFPYDTMNYRADGAAVAKAMVGEFSWQSFAVGSTGTTRYRDWVVNGRRPPRHRDFAAYLEYAVTKAVAQGAARYLKREVTAVDFDFAARKWNVESSDPASPNAGATSAAYDGVVMTGSGRPLPALPGANGRVFDGRSFWSRAATRRIQHLLAVDGPDASVVIIGAGGTGAAIAYSFVRAGITTLPITIVGHEATLFARHDGPFEDRLFTDDVAWKALAPHVQAAFLARTTAGVVWDYVLRNLVSDNITYESYSALGFRNAGFAGPSEPDLLDLEMVPPPDPAAPTSTGTPPPKITTRPATVFVDARGFDRWGFGDFFVTWPLGVFFTPARRVQISSDIGHDLSVCGTLANSQPFPEGLHVPGLGATQGPAATNLMGLGWLADRVLSSYT